MNDVNAFAEGREGDVGGLLRQVNAWSAAMAGRLEDLKRERLEGTDEKGVVRARISGEGRLAGLTIDPRGLRDLDNLQLAQAVMGAIGAAHAAMGERLTELTADLAGPGQQFDPAGGDPLAAHIERVLREG
ncbi:YbaB/EbfC family nucleoid-associated protein [Nonomuraea sp. NPDC002799]